MKIGALCFLCCLAPSISADELGHLFTSPDQRARLHREPRQPKRHRPAPRQVHRAIQLQGVILRPGRALIWIDDEPLAPGATTPSGITVMEVRAGAAVIRTGDAEPAVAIKPGQSIGSDGQPDEGFAIAAHPEAIE